MTDELVTPETEVLWVCGIALSRQPLVGARQVPAEAGERTIVWRATKDPRFQVVYQAQGEQGVWSVSCAVLPPNSALGAWYPTFESAKVRAEQEVFSYFSLHNALSDWARQQAAPAAPAVRMSDDPVEPGPEEHLWENPQKGYWAELPWTDPPIKGPVRSYNTWADFIQEFGERPPDYASVHIVGYYWEADQIVPTDPYYRSGWLQLFGLIRRRGLYWSAQVAVCPADEPAVRQFLSMHFNALKELWGPLGV